MQGNYSIVSEVKKSNFKYLKRRFYKSGENEKGKEIASKMNKPPERLILSERLCIITIPYTLHIYVIDKHDKTIIFSLRYLSLFLHFRKMRNVT